MPFSRNEVRLTSAQERIQRVEEYLKTIHTGRPLSAVPPLWNLRALHDECKHAGHDDLSELCSELETRVIQLQMNHGAMQESVMNELLGMTKSISQRVMVGFDDSMRDAAMDGLQESKMLAEN